MTRTAARTFRHNGAMTTTRASARRHAPPLGPLSPARFLRRYWQKKPLVLRGALPGFEPLVSRARLFALAARADVESRLVTRRADGRWTLAHGPFARSALPPLRRRGWTLLVQGVDLHDDAAHALLHSFRFVPDARLDDLMISFATEGGGVGPHVDSYDVFLLQAAGRRRWRIGRPQDTRLVDGVPLKILRNFAPEEEHVLEPGDLLYLPPQWAHDGVAETANCMTYSIGFRAPARDALAADLVRRLADDYRDAALYRDADLSPPRAPARVPHALRSFAADAVRRLIADPGALDRALGEALTEPKAEVAFDEPRERWAPRALRLDRRTRALYDERRFFINGDSHEVARSDAALLRRLADERRLDARTVRGAGAAVEALLREWHGAGWLVLDPARGGRPAE
jgi:50S ribosomal protein L16 3-hydroxylase